MQGWPAGGTLSENVRRGVGGKRGKGGGRGQGEVEGSKQQARGWITWPSGRKKGSHQLDKRKKVSNPWGEGGKG